MWDPFELVNGMGSERECKDVGCTTMRPAKSWIPAIPPFPMLASSNSGVCSCGDALDSSECCSWFGLEQEDIALDVNHLDQEGCRFTGLLSSLAYHHVKER